MHLGQTIPAMPVKDIGAAVACYRDQFRFTVVHEDDGFAVLVRDDAEVHLWLAADVSWRQRTGGESPVCSGAESFIAGTASFRIAVDDVDVLFAELAPNGVLHSVSSRVEDTDYGTREFATVDIDGNLIVFFRRDVPRPPDRA